MIDKEVRWIRDEATDSQIQGILHQRNSLISELRELREEKDKLFDAFSEARYTIDARDRQIGKLREEVERLGKFAGKIKDAAERWDHELGSHSIVTTVVSSLKELEEKP